MCGCSGIGNCSCDCTNITLEQIAGATGATGPAGTSLIYSYLPGSAFTSVTTGSDVLVPTTPASAMPTGSQLPADELDANGDKLEIEIMGTISNGGTSNQLKLTMGTTNTIFNIPGKLVNENFYTKIHVIRLSSTTAKVVSVTNYNQTGVLHQVHGNFTTNFAANIDVTFEINQDIASSLAVSSIQIIKILS